MAVVASQTRIVNKALALLGTTARILSIGDGTPAAACAAAMWDDALAATLADHPWNFAKRRAALPADSQPPAFGWAFAYTLPADCLRWLPAGIGDADWFEGEVENGCILTDAAAPLAIRYIAHVADLSRWSVSAIAALTLKLAAEMAEAITGGIEGVGDRLAQRYQAAVDAAKTANALENGDRGGRIDETSSWNRCRSGIGDDRRTGSSGRLIAAASPVTLPANPLARNLTDGGRLLLDAGQLIVEGP